MGYSIRNIGIHTLVGLLLGVGFVVPGMWWLSVIGIAWFVHELLFRPNYYTWYWVLYIWTIKYLCALSWFWSAYPIDWLGINLGGFELLLIGMYWLSAAVWLGLGGVLLYVVSMYGVRVGSRFVLLAMPVLWLLAEIAGAWLFSVFSYGPGAILTANFSFGYVGYHLAQHVILIMLAAWGGVYVLTIVLVLLACAALYLWRLQQRGWLGFGCVIFLFTANVSLPVQTPSTAATTTVAIVDTQTPTNSWLSDEGAQYMTQQMNQALMAAKDTGAAYILFPEDSRVFTQLGTPNQTTALLAFTQADLQSIVIDSSRFKQVDQAVLQAVVYDGSTKESYVSQKRYLVPQGEFMPTVYGAVLRLVGLGETVDQLEQRLSYTVDADLSQTPPAAGIPSVLFCFEGVAPDGVRAILQERTTDAPFVAHVVSHGWFHQPHILWSQLESMLRIQAIWNDTYIVSAGNHVLGYVVSPSGEITYPTPSTSGDVWQVGLVDITR